MERDAILPAFSPSLPYDEIMPGSAIALGRSVKKDEFEHGPLTLEVSPAHAT